MVCPTVHPFSCRPGYVDGVTTNPLPGTPAHRVILQYGLADAQVTWLSTHTIARTIGTHIFESNVRYVPVTVRDDSSHRCCAAKGTRIPGGAAGDGVWLRRVVTAYG